MTKQELEAALKHTREKHKDDIVSTGDTCISLLCEDTLRVLNRCIEIPDDATWGQVILLVFPDTHVYEIRGTFDPDKVLGYRMWIGNRFHDFDLDWWFSPYKVKEGN